MANLPPFLNTQYTDEKGYLTSSMQIYNDQLNQALQSAVGSAGFQVSQATTTQITDLEPDVPVGCLWFNTDLLKLQVKTATGIIETITST